MSTTLAGLPLGLRTDPTKFPNAQPYNIAPWNYSGTESVTSLPTGVVDWVLIQLRQASSIPNAKSSTAIASRAGFILTDGTIVDINGGPVRFYNAPVTSNLYPVIFHRNHLSIIANHIVLKTDGIYTYDYTGVNQIYNTGTNGLKELSSGIWGMVSGNADGDRVIQTSDFLFGRTNQGSPQAIMQVI